MPARRFVQAAAGEREAGEVKLADFKSSRSISLSRFIVVDKITGNTCDIDSKSKTGRNWHINEEMERRTGSRESRCCAKG